MGCAAVGYTAALGGTPAGQGWQLMPHVALAHGASAPALVDVLPGEVVLTTLRGPRSHGHEESGGHGAHSRGAHSHGSVGHTHDAEPQRVRGPLRHPADDAQAGEPHRHGDWVHDHAPPPPRPTAPTVVLDKHWLSPKVRMPSLPSSRVSFARADEPAASRTLSVERPPPDGRG